MSSEKQINANRENAKKSTGPKTEEGMVNSSKIVNYLLIHSITIINVIFLPHHCVK